MSETEKHTPGPWELVSLSGYGSPFSIRMPYASNNPDAPKTHYGVQSVRRRADANLIAAAPDMLEALKAADERLTTMASMTGCRSDDEWVWEAQGKVKAAIAKAGGKPS
jgi:hypothetical protein